VSTPEKGFDAAVQAILDEVLAEAEVERSTRVARHQEANQQAMDAINAALPARVRVTYAYCDKGREGWVRKPVTLENGYFHAYVEDLSPGDDNNPTRYHEPRNLQVL
jgi:hypothetical protein